MQIGAILKDLQSEETAAAALLSLGDIVLLAEVETARRIHDERRGEYVCGAARRFSQLASDEDWLRLMTALERAERPAASCLTTMLRWSMARDHAEAQGGGQAACACGSGTTCCTSGS